MRTRDRLALGHGEQTTRDARWRRAGEGLKLLRRRCRLSRSRPLLCRDAMNDVDAVHLLVTEAKQLADLEVAQLGFRFSVGDDSAIPGEPKFFAAEKLFGLHGPLRRVD